MSVALGVMAVLGRATHEATLFAAAGFAIGGLSDFAIDLIWLGRSAWRRAFVYSRHARADAQTLPAAEHPGRIAIFIPAWDESAVIGAMLRHAVATLGAGDWRIYVGAYPNDPATIAAVQAVASPRVRLVVGDRDGPTTKADCLNILWTQLLTDEAAENTPFKAIVLHDAEDVIHASEVRLYDRMIERFDLVQLPVLPLPDPRSRWIGGHYLDEFAESHAKTIVVREAIGAGVPSAGVGCAISRAMLGQIAGARGGLPFDQDSLTEDYELGLRIAQLGGRGAFVRLPELQRHAPVAIRAHFPGSFADAVKQKSRWIAGIALSGWDRLGWHGGPAEFWMRAQDRRAPLAAIVLLAAYGALVLGTATAVLSAALPNAPTLSVPPVMRVLLSICFASMVWRLALRCWFVTRAYGFAEGLRSVPRAVIANIIAMAAARRAMMLYIGMRREGVVRWDKTAHQFPVALGG